MKNKPNYDELLAKVEKLEKQLAKYENKPDVKRKLSLQNESSEAKLSNEKNIEILESISDAFFSLDEELRVTYFNEAAEKLLGIKRKDVLGQVLFDAFPEAKDSIFEKNYTKAAKEQTKLTFETYFEVPPYINWYNVSVYPTGKGVSVYFQVTTEKKRQEEQLKKSNVELVFLNNKLSEQNKEYLALNEEYAAQNEELKSNLEDIKTLTETLKENRKFYEEIIENVQDGIWISDKDDVIYYANKRMEGIAGISREQIQGNNVLIDFPKETTKQFNRYYQDAKNTLKPQWYEVKVKTPAGKKTWQNGWIVPKVKDGKFDGVITTIRDITKRKQAELAEKRHLKKLREIEWMLNPEKKMQFEPRIYGDLSELNKHGVIKNTIEKGVLQEIADDFMVLLGTSSAVYEKNGDYAYGIHTSGWCRLLDEASFKLCRTDDRVEALESGKWLCHETCWNQASKKAILENEITDVACAGGISLYAVPIETSKGVIGSINFGYGNPPTDEASLKQIAKDYQLGYNEVKKAAKAYKKRPEFIVEVAKDRIRKSAKLIAEKIEKKQEEEKAQRYLDVAGVMIVALNATGEVTLINQKGLKIFGYQHHEVIGKNWFDHFLPKEGVEEVKEVFQGLMDGKVDVFDEFENEVVVKSGEKRQMWWHNTLLRMDDGQINGILSSGEDVTEKRQAEEEIEASENRLQRLVDNMNAGVAVYEVLNNGSDFRFAEFNKAAERITHLKKEDVIGKTLLEKFPNMDKSPLFMALQQVNITEQDVHLPPFYYKDEVRQGWRENYLYRLPSGEIVALFEDVTKREEYQRALIESENKFRTIYEMAVDPICIANLSDVTFIDTNPSFTRTLGYSKEELLNRPFTDFIHPEDIQTTIDVVNNDLKAGKQILSFTNRYRCKDGSYRWFDWNSHPIVEKNITYAIAHDVTDIKKYQQELERHREHLEDLVGERTAQLEKTLEELKETESQLIQSEKMVSLGILTSGVAHEINNPLNYIQSGIYGLDNLVKHDCDSEVLCGKVENILSIMQKGVDKASSIVKSLNTFSRQSSEKKKDCNIHRIIENCLLILDHEFKDKCVIKKHFSESDLVIAGNEENLHQVFVNLLMNAVQAISEGGEIVIGTGLKFKNAEITIADNGEGISKSNLKKIFDPFFTTKDPGAGVGIGLSIVYKIIKEHNGSISYKSELNKGTTVTVGLPCKKTN